MMEEQEPHTTTGAAATATAAISAHPQPENIVSSTHADSNTNGITYQKEKHPNETSQENETQSSKPRTSPFVAQSAYHDIPAMSSATKHYTFGAEAPVQRSDNLQSILTNKEPSSSIYLSESKVSASVNPISSSEELDKFTAAHQALLSLSQVSQEATGYVTFTTDKKDEAMEECDSKLINNNSILSKSLEGHSQEQLQPTSISENKIRSSPQDVTSKEAAHVLSSKANHSPDNNGNTMRAVPLMTPSDTPMEIDQRINSKPKGTNNTLGEKTKKPAAVQNVTSTSSLSNAPGSIVHPGFMFAGLPTMPYPTAAFDPNMMAANYAMLQTYMSAYAPPVQMKEVKEARKEASPAPAPQAPKEKASTPSMKPLIPLPIQKETPEAKSELPVDKSVKKDLRTYKCKVCPRIFAHLVKLVRHEKTHLHESPFRCGMFVKKSTDKPFNCLMCNQRFADQISLETHITDNHSSKPSTPVHQTKDIASTQAATNECYRCRYCTKILRTTGDLIKHEQQHLNMDRKRSIEPKEVHRLPHQEMKIQKVEAPKEKLNYTCKYCGKGFDSSYMLERHKYLEKCNPTIVSENQYPLQQRFEQPASEQEFACPICRKKYKCEKLLKSHVKFSHLEERPHVCSICSKAFKQKATLKQHEKLHSEEKPYVCNICSRGFVYPSRLKTHQQTCKPGEPAL